MSCLSNLIGIKGCGTTPHSFYINQLTGINIPDFDKAISIEQQNAKVALTEIIEFATRLVEQDIDDNLQGRYQLKSVVENDVIGYYYDNKILMPAQSGVLTGYEVRIDQVPYLEYYLNEVKLFCNYTGDVPLYIYDLLQGKLLDTITVSAVAGEIVTAEIGKKYATNKQRLRLFIGYDSTFEAYNTSYASPYGSDNCNTCNGSIKNSFIYTRAAKVNVADPKTSQFISGNSTSGGAGLSISYSVQCSFTEYLCNMKNQMQLPILYKAGELVMKELKHSKRLTGVVTIFGKSHDELMMEYEGKYREKIQSLLLNMNMPDSFCFKCTPKVATRVVLP